jgi:phage protein U
MALESYDVVIQQLEGGTLALLLTGDDLPEQGVSAGVEQRLTTTQYPGSSEKSTQFMGSTDGDIQLSGYWRDEHKGLEGHALSQLNTARALCSQGYRCELVWGPYLVREGWLKAVEPSYDRPDVIRYRLTFMVDRSQETQVELRETAAELGQYDAALGLLELLAAAEDAATAAAAIYTVAQAVK